MTCRRRLAGMSFSEDNGAGKSTFLRAVALGLVGPVEAAALRQDWNDWLRRDKSEGRVELQIDRAPNWDDYTGSGRPLLKFYHGIGVRLTRNENIVDIRKIAYRPSPERHVWGPARGWFSASYGPFRRFEGGDKDSERLYLSNPKLARHLSVFGESIALTECIRWLQELQFKKLEADPEGGLLKSSSIS